jgi:hypothetical protein
VASQQQISEEIMYKLALAILLLSTPAFADEQPNNMPQTNLKNTVIPKSGGQQRPEDTPTTPEQANRTDATATRPAKDGPQQSSVPNAAHPPVTTTQTTGATNQEPKIKQMNEEEKQKIETEGK